MATPASCEGCSSAQGCPGASAAAAAGAAAAAIGVCAGSSSRRPAAAAGGASNGCGQGKAGCGGEGGGGPNGGGCGDGGDCGRGGGARMLGAAVDTPASAAIPSSIFSISRDGVASSPPQPKGRRRARMLQEQQNRPSNNNGGGAHSSSAGSGGGGSSSSALAFSWPYSRGKGKRPSFSTRLLIAIACLWLGAAALMLLVPETQALLTYLHWVRWPLWRDLSDLRSFRLEAHTRNIRIWTADGQCLGGWHLLPTHRLAIEASRHPLGSPAREAFFDDALRQEGARAVIYFHGNAASRGHWERVELAKSLASRLDAHVVAVDYRGFGDSTGWPSEEGLAMDARAVWAWVQQHTQPSNPNAPPGEEGGGRGATSVYVYGQSLGAAVAVRLASELAAAEEQDKEEEQEQEGRCEGGGKLAGIVLDSPFSSLAAAALHHPSALPFRYLLPLSHLHERFPAGEHIAGVRCPILVVHGKMDRMLPFQLGMDLYQAARLIRIRSAPHTLEDVWFSALEKGSHSDAYAHAQWTHDLASFMETAEAGLM